MVALEREDGAAQALRELEDMKDTSADGVLRAANGRLDACNLRGDIRASVDETTISNAYREGNRQNDRSHRH